MRKKLIGIYHHLPPWSWSAVASLQAWRLRRRRYGIAYTTALPEIRERIGWNRERWLAFQRRQLAEQLDRAAGCVPAYRGNPIVGGRDPLEVLRTWPLVDVDRFRQSPGNYLDPQYGAGDCVTLYTSGSTGTPKKIVRDARAEQLNYAYAEARWRNTAGVNLDDRWVMIGGQLVVPVSRSRPPFWVRAYPMRQLYMSSYHLQEEFAEDYMRAILAWRPAYLLGYASSLKTLADFSEKTGIRPPLKCILSNAEPLYAHVRLRLQRAFECDVRDTYGGTEGAFQGFECGAGRMHVSPDFGVLEIVDDEGRHCKAGEVGRAVVTGLTNRAMPLIRYPTGDLVAWAVDQRCGCGCSFPVLEHIEGRSDDVLVLPNGRRVGRLDPVFKATYPLREAQIAQRRDGSIEVRVVADLDGSGRCLWTLQHSRQLVLDLHARLGSGGDIRIALVDRIPRGKNGKFKAVVRE